MAQAQLNNKGFAVLLSVIVVGGISTIIATTLLYGSTTSLHSLVNFEKGIQAHQLAHTCAELALQQLKNDLSFSGEAEVVDSQGTCAYTVTNVNDEESIVESRGTASTAIKKIRISVSKLTIAQEEGSSITTIQDTRWQDVANF